MQKMFLVCMPKLISKLKKQIYDWFQGKLIRSDSDGLLPSMQYLENEHASIKFDEHYIHNIKKYPMISWVIEWVSQEIAMYSFHTYLWICFSGTELVKNFNKIVLPLNTLSLLNSPMGIRVLMLSKRTIQEQFLTNLYAVLEQSTVFFESNLWTRLSYIHINWPTFRLDLLFRLVNNVPTGEFEILLNNVIRLHWMYQQGFTAVSRLLSLYLQSWDGYEFRPQIYKLLAWFVFKSNTGSVLVLLPTCEASLFVSEKIWKWKIIFHVIATELNRFVLRPLHSLFVSGDQNEQCDILLCLINLIHNLVSSRSVHS